MHPSILKKILLSLTAVAALGAGAPSASALTITAADLTSGDSFDNVAGVTVMSSGGTFSKKTTAGYTSVGVAIGWEGGEIDLASESIRFGFASEPQIVTELVLANLFVAGEHDDAQNERALLRVTLMDNSVVDYELALTSATTASFTGPGTVSNVSPGLFGDGGVFSITNPFGNIGIKALKLLAVGPAAPTDMRNNDYGFYSLTTVAVPEPGTLMLLGMGLVGLTIAGRKRLGA